MSSMVGQSLKIQTSEDILKNFYEKNLHPFKKKLGEKDGWHFKEVERECKMDHRWLQIIDKKVYTFINVRATNGEDNYFYVFRMNIALRRGKINDVLFVGKNLEISDEDLRGDIVPDLTDDEIFNEAKNTLKRYENYQYDIKYRYHFGETFEDRKKQCYSKDGFKEQIFQRLEDSILRWNERRMKPRPSHHFLKKARKIAEPVIEDFAAEKLGELK